MRTKSDIYREFARILDLCEGTDIKPWHGVKYKGVVQPNEIYYWESPEHYQFALGIVENRFVFEGDVLYYKNGSEVITTDQAWYFGALSWTKPEVKPDSVIRAHLFTGVGNCGMFVSITTDRPANIEAIFQPDGTFKDVRKL